MNPIICLENVCKEIRHNGNIIHILKDINLNLYPGESVALVGPSGSGKSTLLQICGLLDEPTTGKVWVNSELCQNMNDNERTKYRRFYMGFVYQFHYLFNEFDCIENVMLAQMIFGNSKKQSKENAIKILEKMGLQHRLYHRPKELSGGEQQRVAIARSLVNNPKILLADEPTGNLDRATATSVFEQMLYMVKNNNLTAFVATHDMELVKKMDRVLYLTDGNLRI